MAKKSKEKFKVYKNVFDEFTLRTLFHLESKGHFLEEALVPISIGKESIIVEILSIVVYEKSHPPTKTLCNFFL